MEISYITLHISNSKGSFFTFVSLSKEKVLLPQFVVKISVMFYDKTYFLVFRSSHDTLIVSLLCQSVRLRAEYAPVIPKS